MIKQIVKNLIGGIIGTGLVLLGMYLVGIVATLMLSYPIIAVGMGLLAIYLIFKEI